MKITTLSTASLETVIGGCHKGSCQSCQSQTVVNNNITYAPPAPPPAPAAIPVPVPQPVPVPAPRRPVAVDVSASY